MNYYEEIYFVPGNTYDNFAFFCCNENFINKAKQNLDVQTGRIPSVCVEFSQVDSDLLKPFFEQHDDPFQKFVIARTYVNTKIFNQFFNTLEHYNNPISPRSFKLKEQVAKGAELFAQGDVDGINEYYLNTPLTFSMLSHILTSAHNFELNIFLIEMDNQYIQRSINNYLGGRTLFSIKLFTTEGRLCSNIDESYNIIQPVHDYNGRLAFILSEEQEDLFNQ